MSDPKGVPLGGHSHGFVARLQPRERTLVLAFVVAAFVTALALLFFFRGMKLDELEDGVSDLRAGIELAYSQGGVYQRKAAQKQQRESKISSESLLLTTAVEEAAQQIGISARNQQLLQPVDLKDGLRKNAVEFDLRGVTLEQLVDFVAKLESNPTHVVLTENLLVRSPSSTEDRLNVDLTLATWERPEQQEGKE